MAVLGREVDPAGASPGAEINRRAAFRAGPHGKGGSVDRFARPYLAHHREMVRQQLEAALIVDLHGIEITLGRPTADAEAEATARQQVDCLGAMRLLDRMAQRDLRHAGAQFDALGRLAERAEEEQWIKRGAAAGKSIGGP